MRMALPLGLSRHATKVPLSVQPTAIQVDKSGAAGHCGFMDAGTVATPWLRIDGGQVRRNLERLAAYTAAHGLRLRPHAKTHKLLRLAQMQLDAGAVGLTVAKVGEAEVLGEVLANHGLLLAYPVVDPGGCRRVAALATRKTVHVAIDSTRVAEALASAAAEAGSTIGILVDLDVGMGRTGVQSPGDALALAQQVEAMKQLRLEGLFCYPGQIWEAADAQAEPLARMAESLSEVIDLYQQHGLNVGIVSGGSTPTAYQSHLVPQLTEIRPGTYVFNDMNTVRGGYCTLDDCAASLICTVVSTAVPGQVVIDAGSKTLTSDVCVPDSTSGHGYICEHPQARITCLSEEHGQVDIRSCDRAPEVGERVTVIPNHICPCINLQEAVWWAEDDGGLEQVKVDARGKLS